jgi:4-carboxymuconolactone decarboxylase
MSRDEASIYDFVHELLRTRGVSDATYALAVETLGERGVIDLVGVLGYYSTLAMIMNVARTPLPDGQSAGLTGFPG